MSTPQTPHTAGPAHLRAPQPRQLAWGYGASWWSEGWRVFAAAPGAWIGIVVILFVLMFVMVLVPIIGALAQTLLLPVFGGGVMLGCHALARGEPLRVSHLFDGFGAGRFGPLMIIGLVMLAAGFVLAIVVGVVAFATIGFAGIASLASLSDPTHLSLSMLVSIGYAALLITFIGMIGATLIGMAYWFAPALVVLNGVEPLAAMRASFHACSRNFGALLVYGLIYVVLAILATLPLGLGWLVLAPVIAGTCYAGWRTTFA